MLKHAYSNYSATNNNNFCLRFHRRISTKFLGFTKQNYKGYFKINSVIAVGRNSKQVPCRIELVMDHANLLKTNSEDLDIKSESLNASYLFKGKVAKTKIAESQVENLNCKGEFYHKDGTPYHGSYHVHLDTERVMTGSSHSKDSKILFIKKHNKIISTRKKVRRR